MMKRRTILYTLFLLFLIVGTVWIIAFRGTSTLRSAEGTIFGTYYHIKYEAPNALDEEILRALNEVDASMSVFNKESTISRINDGRSERTDALLCDVLGKARTVSEATGGAFDITVMPLVNAWGFGFKQGTMPTRAQVDSLQTLVGWQKVSLTADSLLKKTDSRIMIDCGAIAKGYGVDRVARMLREHGVRNYMIEIGGEIAAKGRNPEGHPWRIGVSKPIDNDSTAGQDFQTVIELENKSMATSGNYRNFYIKDGRKYAHTIDPRSGYPVQHSLLSATVIAPDCATADAYATAFMVMGMDEAKHVLAKHKELRVYFIYEGSNGQMLTYQNFK